MRTTCVSKASHFWQVNFFTPPLLLFNMTSFDERFEKAATSLKYLHFDKKGTLCNYCEVTCNTKIYLPLCINMAKGAPIKSSSHQEKLCSWIFHQHSFWVLQIVKRCISFPHMTIVYVAVWKLLRKHDNNDNHHCHYPGEWLCFCRCLNCCKNSLQHVCRDIITHSKVHAGQNNA